MTAVLAEEQLKEVQGIVGCETAFAAISADPSVVTWGHSQFGGADSGMVQDRLKDVKHARASFAALLMEVWLPVATSRLGR